MHVCQREYDIIDSDAQWHGVEIVSKPLTKVKLKIVTAVTIYTFLSNVNKQRWVWQWGVVTGNHAGNWVLYR